MGSRDMVAIDHKQRDGLHIFTSKDFPGLFVARRDEDQARKEVEIAIATLAKLSGRNVVPKPYFTDTDYSLEPAIAL